MEQHDERNGMDRPRRVIVTGTALAAVAALGSRLGFEARAEDGNPMLMFVQIAEDIKADTAAQTIRLVKVGQQTLYFADRPERIAGHVKMADYLKEWTSKAGKDNFAKDPPNAALSVYEPGQANNKVAVITITNPKVEGADLVYNYKLINRTIPTSGGETSLFIDWIGVGGGVGVGFHGVGVGFRGRGFR